MKKLPILACCVLLLTISGSFAQSRTSMDYLLEANVYYVTRDHKRAIKSYQKAFDLERQERKLELKHWTLLVRNLALAYAATGDIKRSQSVLEYGISKEPAYPLFYYVMALTYGELGDEDNAIKHLRSAFKNKANLLPGETFPEPEKDRSFAKFADSEKITKAVAEMKSGK